MPADGHDHSGGSRPPNQPYRPPISPPGSGRPSWPPKPEQLPDEISQVVDGVSRGARRAWEFVLKPLLASAVGGLAGIILGGVIGEAIGGGEASGSVIALFWLAGALGSFLFMRKRAFEALNPVSKPIHLAGTKEIRAQLDCIRTKCHQLQQAAQKAGAPYGDLVRLAGEMERQAERIAERVLQLRAAAADVRRDVGRNPSLLTTIHEDVDAPELQDEYRAAQEAQRRVDQMLAHNEAQQALCLARIERIEALLDTARLELLRPVDSATDPGTYGSRGIIEEVEDELRVTREALREAEQYDQQ